MDPIVNSKEMEFSRPTLTEFRKQVQIIERRREKVQKRLLESISNMHNVKLMQIPPDVLNKPLHMLKQSDLVCLKVDNKKINANDASMTINVDTQVEHHPKYRKATTRASRNDKFKTPVNKMQTPTSGMVTPKFNPYSTMSVLRKPKEGEIAMSMSGSPLHVSSVINETKPNVVVPLQGGRILSVLPERGLRRSEIPDIDPILRRQLKVLNDNLSAILSLDH